MSTIFDNSYARELEGCYTRWTPSPWPQARELWFNAPLALELGLPWVDAEPDHRGRWLSGQDLLPGMQPLAQAYAGHQFGGFSPQLGDGRALLLGELIDTRGQRRDLALKGSGRTPYSRGGDGKAAIGPMLREVIIGEAMHALGVPTTRALGVVATAEPVIRDRVLPGAVLMRVAASHLRVGTFEYLAARQDSDKLRRLVDYAILRHDPALADREDRHIEFLKAVVGRQARLVARWMGLGFIHGVMNTDNMTISGETIDYGPCAFMEAFDPAAVFSSIDRNGRYAWNNQPPVAQWNLARLAEALLPLIDAEEERALEKATAAVGGFAADFSAAMLREHRLKMGLIVGAAGESEHEEGDRALASDWLSLLHRCSADHTRSWRALAAAVEGHELPLRAEVSDGAGLDAWLTRWRRRLTQQRGGAEGGDVGGDVGADVGADVARAIRLSNPAIIPRNHLVEQALTAATDELDMEPTLDLLRVLSRPYDEAFWCSHYAQAAPPDVAASHRTFCGT